MRLDSLEVTPEDLVKLLKPEEIEDKELVGVMGVASEGKLVDDVRERPSDEKGEPVAERYERMTAVGMNSKQ